MEAVEILIPITAMVMLAAIIIVPRYFKSLERQRMAETVRAAIEKGQPLPPEMVGALAAEPARASSPERDLRRGVILVAVALGMVAAGLTGMGASHDHNGLIGAAAIPGFIGLAFIVISLVERPRG